MDKETEDRIMVKVEEVLSTYVNAIREDVNVLIHSGAVDIESGDLGRRALAVNLVSASTVRVRGIHLPTTRRDKKEVANLIRI
jgi:hypothetical protein